MLGFIISFFGVLVLLLLFTIIGIGVISVAVDLGLLKLGNEAMNRTKPIRNRDDVN